MYEERVLMPWGSGGSMQTCTENASHRLARELLLWPTDSCPVSVVNVLFFLPSQEMNPVADLRLKYALVSGSGQ